MKVVVDLIHQSRSEIQPSTLRKSWRKILPEPKQGTAPNFVPPEPYLAELYKLAVVEKSELASVSQIPEEAKCCGYGIFSWLKGLDKINIY